MSGVVYFVRCGDDGPIKIGHTVTSVYLRVRALQQTSPHILRWIGYFEGGREEETAAHRRLAKHNLRGEWFYPTKEVLDFVEEKSPGFDEARAADAICHHAQREAVKSALFPYRYRKDGHYFAHRIAEDAGVSTHAMYGWLSGSKLISRDDADRLAVSAATFDQMSRAAA